MKKTLSLILAAALLSSGAFAQDVPVPPPAKPVEARFQEPPKKTEKKKGISKKKKIGLGVLIGVAAVAVVATVIVATGEVEINGPFGQ